MEIICCTCKNFDTEICDECSISIYSDGCCSCHIHPPCSYCVNLKYERNVKYD